MILAAVLLGVAAASIAAALVVDVDGRTPEQQQVQATTTTVAELTDPDAKELIALADRGRGATVHARYRVAAGPGPELALEFWRRGDLVRYDSETGGPSAERTATFQLSEGNIGCRRAHGGAWTCTSLPAGAELGPQTLVEQLVKGLEARPVAARTAAVAGQDARCFAIDEPPAGEVCLTAAGVPVLVGAGDARIELVQLDDHVPDEAFVPPARPARR